MKKETRVKDLPEILQLLIFRECEKHFHIKLNAEDCLSKIDWTKATDAERLAYCKMRYPKGTKVESTMGTIGIVGSEFEIWGGCVFCDNTDNLSDSLNLCCKGRFAEIIEEVEESPVEFKEGEMVDVYLEGTWCERKYAFFASGEHWYYNLSINNTVHIADDIRKIDPNKEWKEIAKPILEYWGLMEDGKCAPNVLCAIIEAMKKVQSKK